MTVLRQNSQKTQASKRLI